MEIIRQSIKTTTTRDRVKIEDIVILFSSNLYSAAGRIIREKKPLDDLLVAEKWLEQLTKVNINTTSDKIGYTTALKFKGLEKDVVILVLQDLFNQKIKTLYQMYIGASRAKAKVIMLVDDKSASIAKMKRVEFEGIHNEALIL